MFSSEAWLSNSSDFYNSVATQSLRLHDGDNASLSWTPSSAGNRKKWTFSTWLKRSTITNASSGDQYIFSQTTGSNNNDSFIGLIFRGDDLDVTCASLEVLRTNAKFRDVGAWYHILWVLDTENSTASHRMRLYVNGDEITSFSGDSRSNSQLNGTNMPILNNATHYIGKNGNNTTQNFDGYLAYTELVEGQALTPSDFTEVKNGALIPKEYTGDHGTFGFRLEYKETGDGSSSPSTSTIGADTKSNATKQHWNDNNLDTWDSNLPDSPENKFCTMNSEINGYGTNITMSEGNLAGTGTSGQYNNTLGTILMTSGKWYWEISSADFNNYDMLGIAIETAIQTTDSTPYGQTGVVCYATQGADYVETASGSANIYTNFLASEIIGVAVDLDASPRTVKFYNNNTLQFTESLSSNFDDIGILPFFCIGNADTIKVNFGQDSSFAGLKTAQGNQDENSIGDFYYTPPSGYLALCSSNLPEPTIGANSDTQAVNHFGQLTYTGNGTSSSSTNNIRSGDTDVGGEIDFKPDFTWIKSRSNAQNHNLFDSNRGAGNVLFTNLEVNEADTSAFFTSFETNGFNLAQNGGDTNFNNYTYVAWNWKANGGTTSSNTDGNITTTVQANQTAGFSVITYTGQNALTTIGHGLGKKPAMIIVKQRTDDNTEWIVGHQGLSSDAFGDNKFLKLEESSSVYTNSAVFGATPTTTAIQLTTTGAGNLTATSKDFVAYCFAEIEGYSRFGSFTGNANADGGTYVYLGFRPAFLLVKNTNTTNSWRMWVDDGDGNVEKNGVYPNGASVEDTPTNWYVDWLSNGFKVRGSQNEMNGSGNTIIYMAFGETFKYANAR